MKTVQWKNPNMHICHGYVRPENYPAPLVKRFTISRITEAYVLLDGAERVGEFKTLGAARAIADTRAGLKGVVHYSGEIR